MRKTIGMILTVVLLLSAFPLAQAQGDAQAFAVSAAGSAELVSEQQADEPRGAAGLSKLPAVLTLCSAFDRELIAPDAQVDVSRNAASVGGPTAFLQAGESIAAEELLRAAVMISAGDAIVALTEHVFGSEDVLLQNIDLTLRAAGVEKEMHDCLGTNTAFSCRDLLKLGEAALSSPSFLKYCGVKYAVLRHADGRETELASANKLLTSLSGCIGLFTGSSRTDGYCGIFACKRGDTTFLCAVLGAENSSARFKTGTEQIEEAFGNCRTVRLCTKDEPIASGYPVGNGDADTVELYVREDVSLLLKKTESEPLPVFDLPDALTAPLDPAHAVGTVAFLDGEGKKLVELALYPGEAIASTGFRDILKRIAAAYTAG